MLKAMRGSQRWLTGFFIVALGGVFVFFLVPGMGQQSGPSGGTLIEVGSYRFGVPQFEAERARRVAQYEQALGDQFDANLLGDQLNEITAGVLVERAILADEAGKIGIVVAKGEIERAILQSPSFRGEDGRFDNEAFDRFIAYEYGTERNFMVDQRLSMLAGKMMRLIGESSRVSTAEARDALFQRLEEVKIAFVVLDSNRNTEDIEVDEARITAFLAEREEEARTLYSQRASVYDVPEQVRARHVLLKIAPGADEAETAETEARARKILKRLQEGEDFATVATEVSDDPGSKSSGGDLGFFGRGQMVKPFEDVAFSLEPGELSDVVHSDFGFHVIRVEEHNLAKQTPFEEVREELASELVAKETSVTLNREVADKLSAAVRAGSSLEDAARAEELTLERSDWLRRRPDGYVPGLGAAQDLMITAFALSPGQSSDRVYEVDSKLALVQLLERQIPEDVNIEQGVEQEREQLSQQKRTLLTQGWLNERRKELADAGELVVDLSLVNRGR
ncbi:MAG: peptidylprolyl isomerase [Deltaproteobacteria bacterium]|nr:peptidylprolyl isomerase [Deltaproteobacteria bacterium]MBW2665653.1 peptidylprolyl isomerase [Deltaproteobacteria bacterium]